MLNTLLRRLSIRWKVVAIMLSVTVVSLSLAGVGLLWHTRLALERQAEQRLALLADVIGRNSAAALVLNDQTAARDILAALRSDRHLLLGAIYDVAGALVAGYARPGVSLTIPPTMPSVGVDGAVIAEGSIAIVRPIELRGQPLGSVYLVADTAEWMPTLRASLGILGPLVAAILFLGSLVAIWLQRIVTQPITALAALARRVGRERNYTLRADKHSDDEIGALADGFNDMLREIGQRRAEVERAQQELSRRVAELDAEVTERRRAEAELRISREQLANFIENANVGMHWVDANGVIIWANRYELDMLGYTAEEYIGHPITEFYEDPEKADWVMRELRHGNTIENYEVKLRHEDGSIRDGLINSSGYFEDGKFVHTRCFTRDITERKHTEDALRQSEERYRTLVDASASVVFMLDGDGHAVERQPSWEKYTGQAWHDYVGAGMFEMIHPDDREHAELTWKRALARRDVHENEMRVWNARTQSHRHCAVRIVPLKADDGHVREWIGTLTDIDDRKRAEEQFRLAVEAAPNAMVMIDQAGLIVLANRQLESLFGYSREQLLGQPIDMLVPDRARQVHPEFRGHFFASPEARAMGAGRDLYGQHKDGRQVPLEIGLNPFVTSDGAFCLASIIDITERKRAEHDLRRYTEELQRSNRELAQFAYVASHDLQEPLRAISGCVQLLQQRYEKKLDARADELIEHAVSGAVRMQALINDLLSYSRVGTRGKAFEPCNLEQPLQEALANLTLAVDEAQAKITWDDLPVVSGDPTQLTQVFQNLIGNALKFRGREVPHVHVGVQSRAGGYVISVADNGIGIEPQYFDRIFGVFQRLHSRNKYPGNGIGLAICRKILERHNGRMWVESAPGQGSTFYFTIPIAGVQNEQPERYGQKR